MNREEKLMSVKEMAYDIINNMTEEQLKGFIMMFRNSTSSYESELSARISDIENGRNLSEAFNSFDEFLEDLNAED